MDKLKDVADYWRKVKSGELPAPGPNEISITVCTLDGAVSRMTALLAELEASKQYAKERDTENESLALTVGRLRVELHNEGAANAHAYERIRGLEKRLATPVRLPPLMDGELCGKYGAKYGAAANAHNNAITACSIAICGAGFKSEVTAPKCVGDEQ